MAQLYYRKANRVGSVRRAGGKNPMGAIFHGWFRHELKTLGEVKNPDHEEVGKALNVRKGFRKLLINQQGAFCFLFCPLALGDLLGGVVGAFYVADGSHQKGVGLPHGGSVKHKPRLPEKQSCHPGTEEALLLKKTVSHCEFPLEEKFWPKPNWFEKALEGKRVRKEYLLQHRLLKQVRPPRPLLGQGRWAKVGVRRTKEVKMRKIWILLAAFLTAGISQAGELAGVVLPDQIAVGEHKLLLNGMGLRKKAVFKVYVGALYLTSKSTDAQAILAADSPRRMVMHFLRNVGKGRLVGAWKEGFTANVTKPTEKLSRDMERFLGFWGDVKAGEEVVMTYVPGQGTAVSFGGKEVGRIEGKAFADALLAVWLGPKPPSSDFKARLLGK